MKINVRISQDIARSLQGLEKHNNESEELLKIGKELGFILRPIFPGANDPHLISHFNIEVPDSTTAEKIIKTLQNRKGVEAAYIKPSAELPAQRY